MLELFNALSHDNKIRIKERAAVLAELEKPVADEPANEIEPEESRLNINCSTYQVSAGAGFELGEGDEWYEIEVPDTPEARKADFALHIKGNSMEPIYFDGDIVLVKEQPSVDLGQIGIFDIEGNGYIKKFGGDRLISLNAEYDDIVFSDYDEDRIRCFGKVIGRVYIPRVIYILYKKRPPNQFAALCILVRRFEGYFEYFLYFISHGLFKNMHLLFK